MMSRRNNFAIRESNDYIDHKKALINSVSFADEVKYFSEIIFLKIFFQIFQASFNIIIKKCWIDTGKKHIINRKIYVNCNPSTFQIEVFFNILKVFI